MHAADAPFRVCGCVGHSPTKLFRLLNPTTTLYRFLGILRAVAVVFVLLHFVLPFITSFFPLRISYLIYIFIFLLIFSQLLSSSSMVSIMFLFVIYLLYTSFVLRHIFFHLTQLRVCSGISLSSQYWHLSYSFFKFFSCNSGTTMPCKKLDQVVVHVSVFLC